MKQTIKLNNKKLTEVIKESVSRLITEANNKREIANQVVREILGTDSFEEFYRNTGFWVGARDFHLMSEYFKKLAEIEEQNNNQNNGMNNG